MCDLFHHVDPELAQRVAAGIGVREVTGDLSYLEESSAPLPNDRRGAAEPGRSAALSMADTVGTAKSRTVALLVADGVDAAALSALRSALEDAGARPVVVAETLTPVTADDGTEVEIDKSHLTGASVAFDAVAVPGGADAVAAMVEQGKAVHFLAEAYKHCKPITALGAGIDLLPRAGLDAVDTPDGDDVVDDLGVITSAGGAPGAAAGRFVEAIAAHRHWARQQRERIPA
jgi:catalase